MFKLYFKGSYLGTYKDREEAEATARWTYFEWYSMSYEGEGTPPGFVILGVLAG